MNNEQSEQIIDALNKCALDCIHCETACLDEENVQGLVQCIRLDRECAELCLFTAKMIAADAELSTEILNLCSKICDLCGDECDQHASHMEHCRICAQSCRRCAEECRSFVNVSV